MLYLEKIGDTGTVHYLHSGEVLRVSRQSGSHIYLPGDRSISRLHATITVLHHDRSLENLEIEDEVSVKDESSTYGTFICKDDTEDRKLKKNECIQLHCGETIKFGVLQESYKLCSSAIIATSSQLKVTAQLKKDLLQLSGYLIKDFQPNCTYLIMSDLLLTVKTVCALVSAIHIVTPQYFSVMLEAIKKKQAPPPAENYLPPVKEKILDKGRVNFAPNKKRKTLFKLKKFIFSSEKCLLKLGNIVKLAGGTAMLLSENSLHFLENPSGILVNGVDEKKGVTAKLFGKATEILKKNNLNAIPESDIGLAIAYISTEKYCNPTFSVNKLLRPQTKGNSSQATQSLQIFASETEDMNATLLKPSSSKVILESFETASRDSNHTGNLPRNLRMAKPSSATVANLDDETEPFESQSTTIFTQDTTKRSLQVSLSEQLPVRKKHKSDADVIDCSAKRPRMSEDILSSGFNPPFCSTENPLTEQSPIKSSVDQNQNSKDWSLQINLKSLNSFNLDDVSKETSNEGRKVSGKRKEPSVSPVKIEAQDVDEEVNKRAENQAFPTVKNLRKRAKITDQENHVVKETPSTTVDQDEFYIPVRKSRHARASQKPQESPVKVEPVDGELEETATPPRPTEQSVIVESNQNFVPCKNEVKQEQIVEDAVSKLGESIEKSLVVVEVADLVVSCSISSTRTSVASNNGLPNFKKFKKASVQDDDAPCFILPRILGGSDLVPHQEAQTIREDFIASQSHLIDLSDKSSGQPSQPTVIDHEFDLPMARSRAKIRNR